jgi:uncharacterized membrane protein
MISLGFVYATSGLAFVGFALLSARDRANPKRFGNALFWGLLATSFLFGSYIGDLANGVLVLLLVLIGGLGLMGHSKPATTSPSERLESARRRGNWLFAPALIVPAATLGGTLLLPHAHIVLPHAHIGAVALVDPKQVTLVSLALACILALLVAALWLRPPLAAPLQEGRRLVDAIGWAAVLPQMLAALGAVFALAGVGKAVGNVATNYIPLDKPLEAVIVYCAGMALFTAVMGNAFAAFPVMTAAIGLPLIVHKFHGDPAIMAAIGMLSGFCGTLTTPMAANFNIVPAALLELPDRNGVIKVQIPTAALMLLGNIVLMAALVYRF